jgi:UDP-2,3-diacylglucosamine hydrolase
MSALYFISDVHLGIDRGEEDTAREDRLLELLSRIESDGDRLCILGDLFDFWFEYRRVVPAGAVRILNALRRLVEAGVEVHYLAGNHDFALGRYLTDEIGCLIHLEPCEMEYDGTRFYLHHGDGLADRDLGYRLLKRFLRNRFIQALWRLVHPDLGFALARLVSSSSRNYTDRKDYGSPVVFESKLSALAGENCDWIIMGHTHEAELRELGDGTRYLNLGSWLEGGAPHARFHEGELTYEGADGSLRRADSPAPD